MHKNKLIRLFTQSGRVSNNLYQHFGVTPPPSPLLYAARHDDPTRPAFINWELVFFHTTRQGFTAGTN